MNRQGEGNEREKGCVCDLAPRGTLFPNLRVLCYLSHLHSATSAYVTFLPALQCLFTPRLAHPRCSCTRAHDTPPLRETATQSSELVCGWGTLSSLFCSGSARSSGCCSCFFLSLYRATTSGAPLSALASSHVASALLYPVHLTRY